MLAGLAVVHFYLLQLVGIRSGTAAGTAPLSACMCRQNVSPESGAQAWTPGTPGTQLRLFLRSPFHATQQPRLARTTTAPRCSFCGKQRSARSRFARDERN